MAESLIPLLQLDIPDTTHKTCMNILQKTGSLVSLDALRQDNWFDELKAEVDPENIDLVSRILGKRYFAYSLLLGLQITSIRQHSDEPGNTIVEFTSDSEMVQKLPLSQFNMQVASVLLGIGINAQRHCTLPLTDEQALTIIGEVPLLVAPLFEIFPTHLAAVQKGALFNCVIGLATPKGRAFLAIEEFDKLILQLLRFDVQRYGQGKIDHDFDTEPALAAYEQQDYQQVINLLETWPGLLSTMLKTPAQKELSDKQLMGIAKGCQLLSSAFEHIGNSEYAQEVIRLGIRYTADTPYAGPLYLEMGLILNKAEQFGEAIAYLRRATRILPTVVMGWSELGKALMQRHRCIAAWLVLEHAMTLLTDSADSVGTQLDQSARKDADAALAVLRNIFNEANIVWPK